MYQESLISEFGIKAVFNLAEAGKEGENPRYIIAGTGDIMMGANPTSKSGIKPTQISG